MQHTAWIAWLAALVQVGGYLVLAPLSGARTLAVPSRYETIQAAIDAARDGDRVLVAPGAYAEKIDFRGRAIRLASVEGPHLTRIVVPAGAYAVQFERGESWRAMVRGFTVQGGGGICCRRSAPVIRGNWIEATGTGSAAEREPALLASILCGPGSEPHVIDNWITGRGIHCEEATARVRNNEISGCTARDGGAVFATRSTVDLAGNVLRGNRADRRGGGLYAAHSAIRLVNNALVANQASAGGGLFVEGGSLELLHNTIVDNVAATAGGGLASRDAAVTAVNIIFWNNRAPAHPEIHGQAGAISVRHGIVRGGWPGEGVLDRDPLLVADGGDFHLTFQSPARGRGLRMPGRACRLDIDGNERRKEAGIDIGADQFAPHLYAHRPQAASHVAALRATGEPGTPVLLGCGPQLLSGPVLFGARGFLWLYTPVTLLALESIPPAGWLSLPVPTPRAFPAGPLYPAQAWVGTTLTAPVMLASPR
ncbi:MAG: right-handed parallel beta-helix repeat-containing protein [Planctomycetes bacterium]|nr:right-handed parallel beta-helix repeat-containing protein [Planctomycetota bacterium]